MPALRRDEEGQRGARGRPDHPEILAGIVVRVRLYQRHGHERDVDRDQRVTVGRRMSYRGKSHTAARPGTILDDNRLAEHVAEGLTDTRAIRSVGPPAAKGLINVICRDGNSAAVSAALRTRQVSANATTQPGKENRTGHAVTRAISDLIGTVAGDFSKPSSITTPELRNCTVGSPSRIQAELFTVTCFLEWHFPQHDTR